MQIIERPGIKTRVRLWTLDEERFPDRTPEQWINLVNAAKEGRGLSLHDERCNLVMYAGMNTLASILRNGAASLPVWQDGAWHQQAIGTGTTAPTAADTQLTNELMRKPFTDFGISGRVVNSNTIFTGTDFASASAKILAAPVPTTTVFTVDNISGYGASSAGPIVTSPAANNTPSPVFAVGDLIQIPLASGYEYHTISAIAGSQITLADACSTAPAAGAIVSQVIDEVGLFGDKPANYSTGTVTVAAGGSTTVTGTGTAWTTNTVAGDQILMGTQPATRAWYTIQTVVSDTQLTLTVAAPAVTAIAYKLRGTMFNHVSNERYVKLVGRGFVVQVTWSLGG